MDLEDFLCGVIAVIGLGVILWLLAGAPSPDEILAFFDALALKMVP